MPEMILRAEYCIQVEKDPDSDGFFANFIWDPNTRGYGSNYLSAMLCLILIVAEAEDLDLSEQADDIIGSAAVMNLDIEAALERRYGGRIDYLPNRKLSR